MIVTVVSKHGCHLCEEVLEALDSLTPRYRLEVKVVYVEDDPTLYEKYWLKVPVVQIGASDIFDARQMGRGRDSSAVLEQLLRSYG